MGYQVLGVSTAGRERERERRTGIGWAVYHMLRARRFPSVAARSIKQQKNQTVFIILDVEEQVGSNVTHTELFNDFTIGGRVGYRRGDLMVSI